RHLNLAPLGGQARGLVACIFHEDRSPSLSVDLELGVFHCFGCGAQGGLQRFAELTGERTRDSKPPARRGHARSSLLATARRRAAQQVQRDVARAAEWAPWNDCADFIRSSRRVVDEARAVATTLGPDHPRVCRLLELAAEWERLVPAIEAELDDLLAGRVTGEPSLASIFAAARGAA